MRCIARFTFALLLGLPVAHQAHASLVLAEFDVTHAVASTTTPIAVNNPTAGVISSALVPVGVNGNGASTPGLYWDASWTTSSTPNSLLQRLFFNVIPSANVKRQSDNELAAVPEPLADTGNTAFVHLHERRRVSEGFRSVRQ